MIKHQVELVNVVSKYCPLHNNMSEDTSEDTNDWNDIESTIAQPSEHADKKEIICLCDVEEVNPTAVSTY